MTSRQDELFASRAEMWRSSRRRCHAAGLAVLVSCVLGLSDLAQGTPVDVAIVQPGAPGSPEKAAAFLDELGAWLRKETGLVRVRASYENRSHRALEALRSERPGVAVVSLGFYLAHREELGMHAVLEARPAIRYGLWALEGAAPKPGGLAGNVVAGSALYDMQYLDRLVFAREPDRRGDEEDVAVEDPPKPRAWAPVSTWRPKPMNRVAGALYQLRKGKVAAVVLSSREADSLKKLGRLKSLELFRESSYYPQALVVTFAPSTPGDTPAKERDAAGSSEERPGLDGEKGGRPGSGEPSARKAPVPSREQRLLVGAFRKLGREESSRELLRIMACESFKEVPAEQLEAFVREYGAADPKRQSEKKTGGEVDAESRESRVQSDSGADE